MKYTLNLGALKSTLPPRAAGGKDVFRLAVLGDFSGRASGGQLATGDELAKRKALAVDVDILDDVLARMKINLTLPLAADGGAVEIPIASLDDFHPDQLYENVELFSGLSGLRQRLKNSSTFAKAAAEVQQWLGAGAAEDTSPPARKQAKPRASAVPATGKLSDFARLVGQPTAKQAAAPVDQLLKQLVGPFVVPAKDPQQDKLLAAVDRAISQTMRSILHHPDFQALESVWRGVELLVRRLETGANFRIVLIDISAEEFAADLSSADDLTQTGLYKLLVEQPALDAQQGSFSAIVSNYAFEQTPPHAELLGRMARIAAAAQAPFLASIGVDVLKKVRPEDVHPLVRDSWQSLKAMPEAAYLGLTVPRFMLRNPYGERTDPIDRFDFEEFTPQEGLRGMLYASGAVLAGLLLGQTFLKGGMKKMELGSVMSAGDMPYYVYEDADGDQVALPCTERLLSVDLAAYVTSQRFIPVLAIKGRPEVRLGSFQSLAGQPLAGPWAPVTVASPSADVAESPALEAAAPVAVSPAPEAEDKPAETVETPQPDSAEAATGEAASAGDAELDALLASLGQDSEPPPTSGGDAEASDAGDLDPELAALLADL